MPVKIEAAPVVLEYPQENEKITSSDYTFRIRISKEIYDDVSKVEVSIDKGSPRQCRNAIGYYWYDWSGYESGEHQIVAVAGSRNGKKYSSSPRRFFVELEH